jgi:hypothetical protein
MHGKLKNAYTILIRIPEGTTLSGRPKHRSEDNIKMHLDVLGMIVWTRFIWNKIWSSGRLLQTVISLEIP